MKQEMGMTGERSNHKVAGIFNDDAALAQCKQELEKALGQSVVMDALNPESERVGRRLEPESTGIWRTLVRSHLWLALAGAVIGLIIFAVMVAMGVAFVVQNLLASAALLIVFCAAGGAMLGGLVTLRPDHVPLNTRIDSALDNRQFVLLVHLTSADQMSSAKACLERHAEETLSTL